MKNWVSFDTLSANARYFSIPAGPVGDLESSQSAFRDVLPAP
jgi:hypothetical protein